jgi:hypothetical protein
MLRSKNSVFVLAAALSIAAFTPVHAGSCQLVKATHSADTRAEALKMSQALAIESANELKRDKGWKSITMTAHKVKGDPFWKTMRPNGVPPEAQLRPDVVTARTYTTCFTGVVVPYVCTTGSTVCRN